MRPRAAIVSARPSSTAATGTSQRPARRPAAASSPRSPARNRQAGRRSRCISRIVSPPARRYTACRDRRRIVRHRRFVGRLDAGADLLAQLNEVCRAHDVARRKELRATGTVEDATVGEQRLAGPAGDPVVRRRRRQEGRAGRRLARPRRRRRRRQARRRARRRLRLRPRGVGRPARRRRRRRSKRPRAPPGATSSPPPSAGRTSRAVRPAVNLPDDHNEPSHSSEAGARAAPATSSIIRSSAAAPSSASMATWSS